MPCVQAQVLLTVQMQLAESTTLNKVLDFEVKHLTSMEVPALKVCLSTLDSCKLSPKFQWVGASVSLKARLPSTSSCACMWS